MPHPRQVPLRPEALQSSRGKDTLLFSVFNPQEGDQDDRLSHTDPACDQTQRLKDQKTGIDEGRPHRLFQMPFEETCRSEDEGITAQRCQTREQCDLDDRFSMPK
jgi:hypothetical protein